jgi:hypothetical protein
MNEIILPTKLLDLKSWLFLILFSAISFPAAAQDSISRTDSFANPASLNPDSLVKQSIIDKILSENALINRKPGVATPEIPARHSEPEGIFYLLLILTALLAFLKFFYDRYFQTLFRVFFNTTLRQGQLTDQLMQAKLASLFFNVLFCLSAGVFVFFMLHINKKMGAYNPALLLFVCILSVASVYAIKYLTLKFTGWLTGLQPIVDTYIFIIFLVNKILGILLIPLLILMAFADDPVRRIALYAALFTFGLLLLSRLVRAFGLLQRKIRVSRLHFLLYIAGIEVVPMLVLGKALMDLLDKNL